MSRWWARLSGAKRWSAAAVVAVTSVGLLALPVSTGEAVAAGQPTFVQGTAFTTATRVVSTVVNLGNAVGSGDLLVGWFAQYNTAGQVSVSDNVNGAWTRASGSTVFQSGTGDIALYYLPNAKVAPSGVQVTVSAGAAAYFQGTISDYSGVAAAGPLDQVVSNRGVSTAVNTGPTAAVPAGELVVGAFITGGNPTKATAGASFTQRATTSSGSAFSEDILNSVAGTQTATATLGSSTDWYAVAAAFRVSSTGDTQPPTLPGGLHATSVTSTSVGLAWTASTDNVGVTGYTVYRNGTKIATTAAATVTYTDATAAPATSYTYTVDAFDAAGNHSSPSTGLPVTTATPNAAPTFVQGTASTGSTRTAAATVTLTKAVGAGDLLVGWFAQYNTAGQVSVSDNVNGAWTRAPASTAFQSDTGDIALYYLPNAKAAPGGVQITSSVSGTAYFQESIGDYAGVAIAGPLDQIVSNRAVSTAVDTGPTAAVPAGELVFSAFITGGNPTSATPGSSQGVKYTTRAETGSASAYSEDILGSAAGTQDGTATLGSTTDWYAVAATFRPVSTGDTQAPTTPAGLQATSVASSSVSVGWSASTDNVGVTGYTVYRNGTKIATTSSGSLSYTDATVAPATSYTYTVDAFDAAGNHSPPSAGVGVTTPASSPAFVQGASNSPGTRSTSTTISFTAPVTQGHLLAGWFAQYDASGQVQVSDSVNGAWTRSPASEHFTSGGGDIALFYMPNSKAAPSGVTITISAATATYLPSAAAEFSGVATTAALDQTAVGEGIGTAADTGLTGSVAAGDLVVGMFITGGQPLSVTPGTSENAPFTLVVHNGSESADVADIPSSNLGTQHTPFTLASSMDWYDVTATFKP